MKTFRTTENKKSRKLQGKEDT